LLKKESRILGLSATPRRKDGTIVVGVIFRGSSWLDGILTCNLRSRNDHKMLRLSRAILRSRQYSQLHAVIISSNQTILQRDSDIAELARRLKLPVILLLKRARRKKPSQPLGVEQHELDIKGDRLHASAKGIPFKEIQELITVGCTPDSCLPEAVRVADLIAKRGLCLLEP
jgi:endonuclease V-like protein UPF0215 family